MSYEEPESKGLSTGAIVAIVAVVVVVVLGLACCGGVVFWGRGLAQKFQQSFSDDPQRIAEIAGSISSLQVPPEYAPQFGMDFGFGLMQMKMTAYARADESGMVMLMEMQAPPGTNKQQVEASFRQSLQQQGHEQAITETSRVVRKITINDEESEFAFVSGKAQDTQKAVRQVSGVFPGRGGPAFLMIFDTEENWDEDAIVRMIESLGGTLGPPEETPGAGAAPGGSGPGERAAPPDASAAPAGATAAPD
jgi:hypothetical protein